MEDIKEHLKDIAAMRNMMEQNSKFLSLSGLSGISAGIIALLGAAAAFWKMFTLYEQRRLGLVAMDPEAPGKLLEFLVIDALLVVVLALLSAAFFSRRMAKRKGLPVWSPSSKLLLLNLGIPLAVGGAFCLILVFQHLAPLVPAMMLIFYGMALLNASKFTLPEIKLLAYSEMVLGLISAIWIGESLIFWSIGFGILHIVYGVVMYWKYER